MNLKSERMPLRMRACERGCMPISNSPARKAWMSSVVTAVSGRPARNVTSFCMSRMYASMVFSENERPSLRYLL